DGIENVLADPTAVNKVPITAASGGGAADTDAGFEGKAYARQHGDWQNPYGSTGQTVEIYFGRPSYLEGVSGDTDPITYQEQDNNPSIPRGHPGKPAVPANFLYCQGKNVAVWGCPDRDLTIYTDKDIYICGDFNQSPWHHQIYTSQDRADAQACARDGRDARYVDPVRFAIDPAVDGSSDLNMIEASREGSTASSKRLDCDQNQNLTQERKLVKLMAKGRIWFDYRFPSRFMANEMIPWMEAQLLWHLATANVSSTQPDPSLQSQALAAVTYASEQEFSKKSAAEQLNFSGTLNAAKDSTTNDLTPIAQAYVKEILCFDPSVNSAGYDAAKQVLLAELAAGPVQAAQVHRCAEKLFFGVVCPQEKTSSDSGIWKMAQKYYDKVFKNDPSRDDLNQFASGYDQNERRLRLYVPEMTINAAMVDGARRKGTWDANPHADAKIYNELGNANAGNYKEYLRFQNAGGYKASPAIGRVYGSLANLRQNDPDPDLTTNGGVYMPLKRKRLYPRSQSKWLSVSLRFGNTGDGGLQNAFRVVSRRENILASERIGAEQSLRNWQ
ncbi:MAG: hypothetical protein HY815_18790, partial [Candidatus Riflebacteria bacterium]|nr:hypothetical protein [Candidatus Riflebacteria bacterium]